MPKSKVRDLITDQEMVFARLVLSGTMTDQQAAEAASLNPATAAYTKAKPRVREYMLQLRAATHERIAQQETEEVHRLNQVRERVLARLWKIADLDPEMTRNSMSAQIKAISMIVAIEGLIPDRRAAAIQNKPAVSQLGPAADAPSDLAPLPGIIVHPFTPSETTPSGSHARVPDPTATEKRPDTLRLRL